VNVLFAVDQLVKGVLAALTGLVSGIATVLPLPGMPALVNLLRAFLRIAVGFIDEVILAYAIRSQATNPWRSAETALILYAQNYKIMLKNAAWLALVVYLLGLVVFIVMLTPAAAIAFLFPGGWAAIGVLFALLFTWSLKAALLEPFAIACLMQVYFRAIEGQNARSSMGGTAGAAVAEIRQAQGSCRGLGATAGGRVRSGSLMRLRIVWVCCWAARCFFLAQPPRLTRAAAPSRGPSAIPPRNCRPCASMPCPWRAGRQGGSRPPAGRPASPSPIFPPAATM
jgi:hypothetical protein